MKTVPPVKRVYGWGNDEKLRLKPWTGLTPEDAYRKGVQDGKAEESEQERLRDEIAHPECKPRLVKKRTTKNGDIFA